MWKWVLFVVCAPVFGFITFEGYETYLGGYFSMPDVPDGAYVISFKSGLRAIVLDADVTDEIDGPAIFRRLAVANPDRKYLGVPTKLPSWFKDRWSLCKKPTAAEEYHLRSTMPAKMREDLSTATLDATCTIEADREPVLAGLLFSVPRK